MRGRASTSYLVWEDGKARVLLDAGGGSALRFGESGARVADIDAVLFSHLHSDHSADFPVLVKSSQFEVAQALGGVLPGAAFLTGTGGEKLPEGLDPHGVIVERSVPAAAMADALLAWEMNGAPISLAHGGPLRLIVPGYTGVNNIKYIKRLAFTPKETEARIMSHGYRISPPGGKGDPSQPSVQEMSVKSWINSPAPDAGNVKSGLVQIHGVAFGGLNAVKRVEVSLDGGKSWGEARFVGPDLGRFAWRQFALAAKLPAGNHTLASRATDAAGNVQPEQRMGNAGGYNNTSWADHAVKVTVA